jgi:putative peptidoglycan lipid II flippase
MYKKIIKNTTLIGSGTILSRILGFIRDILQAKFFGTSPSLEAFLVAFRLPNIFRSIFAEGFNDSVVTPTLSGRQKEEIFTLGNHLVSLIMVVLTVFTAAGIIFSRYLVMLVAPGFMVDYAKFETAIAFTRITFIYLLFIGLASIVNSMLYTLKRFFVPALNPVFLNLSFIIGIGLFYKFYWTLVICVLAGGLLEIVFPWQVLRQQGFIFRFNWLAAVNDPTLKKMLKMFLPRVWAGIVYQLSVFIDTIFASFAWIVGSGAVAGLYYATRIIQFPFALVALSIAPVITVDMAAFYKQEDINGFKKVLVFALQNAAFFVIPLVSVMLFIPELIIDVLFRRGEFSYQSMVMTASILFYYSLGLLFSCWVRILTSAFYALSDTSVPAKTATIALLSNIVFNTILMYPLKIGGIALATSISALINFIMLYSALIRKIGPIGWKRDIGQLTNIFAISLIIGIISRLGYNRLSGNKYFCLIIILFVDTLIFFIAGYLLKLPQINYLLKKIFKK